MYSGRVPLPFDPIAEAERQWAAHEWGEIPAMAAATAITRAHQIVLSRINEALKPLGLTFSRYEALVLLHFSSAGSLPLGKMGERLMVHPTSVTNTIDRLEADGLVERLPHPDDRRTTLAALTEEGLVLVERATKEMEAIRFGVDGMSDDEIAAANRSLHSLRAGAGDFTTDKP